MAKDFKNTAKTGKAETGINTGAVYAAIERGKDNQKAQPVASAEEQKERAAAGKTQGRKGCKQVRINTAFITDNYDYITIMSRLQGLTMTDFINQCIAYHKENNRDVYDKARALIDALDTEKEGENAGQ